MPNENKRSLAGKVALVTGASRGIGRAIAQRLAAGGAAVVATARSLDQAKAEPGTLMETVALIETNGGRAIALAADIERAEDREALIPRAVQAAGALDILVNNAGYADYAKVENMTDATFERTITHYLGAPFVLSRAAIPYMRARGAGWIVNVCGREGCDASLHAGARGGIAGEQYRGQRGQPLDRNQNAGRRALHSQELP